MTVLQREVRHGTKARAAKPEVTHANGLGSTSRNQHQARTIECTRQNLHGRQRASMPRSRKKEPQKRAKVAALLEQLRPGMPAKDSVREVLDFVSPHNVRYKILRTTEMDVYDPVPKPKKKRSSKS